MGGRYSVKVSTTKDEKVATYDADTRLMATREYMSARTRWTTWPS